MQLASLTKVKVRTNNEYYMPPFQQLESGFGLIELLIVLSIIATIAFSTSFYLTSSPVQQVTQQRQQLQQFIYLARQKAIVQRQTITICPVDINTQNTAKQCINQWLTNNWYMFVDSNNNKAYDQGEQLMNTLTPIFLPVTTTDITQSLRWRNNNRFLRFSATGSINAPGTMKYCRQTTQDSISFDLIISRQGRIRHQQSITSNPCL